MMTIPGPDPGVDRHWDGSSNSSSSAVVAARRRYLPSHNNTLTTNTRASTTILLITILRLGTTSLGGLGDIPAATAATVELDTVTLAGDPVAVTATVDRRITHGRQRRRRRRARAAGRQRRTPRAGRTIRVGVLIGQTGASKATSQIIDGGRELRLAELA